MFFKEVFKEIEEFEEILTNTISVMNKAIFWSSSTEEKRSKFVSEESRLSILFSCRKEVQTSFKSPLLLKGGQNFMRTLLYPSDWHYKKGAFKLFNTHSQVQKSLKKWRTWRNSDEQHSNFEEIHLLNQINWGNEVKIQFWKKVFFRSCAVEERRSKLISRASHHDT